jgi:hypothetical protein
LLSNVHFVLASNSFRALSIKSRLIFNCLYRYSLCECNFSIFLSLLLKSFSRIFRELPIFEFKLINSADTFTAFVTSSIFPTSWHALCRLLLHRMQHGQSCFTQKYSNNLSWCWMHVICTVFRVGNNDSYFSIETTECHYVAVRALWYFEHAMHNSSGQEINTPI